jgi:hypothetical protein
MEQIIDKDENVIRESRNLRGVKDYARTHLVKSISLRKLPIRYWEGHLAIIFENDETYTTCFASFEVLVGFVQRWRNVRGAPLLVNGVAMDWDEFKKFEVSYA